MDHTPHLDSTKKAEFIAYIDAVNSGVIATSNAEHGPESAFIHLAVMPDLGIVFETLVTSRKYRNLQRDQRASLVIGGHGKTTLQIEGDVEELTDVLRDEAVSTYFRACPQNQSHRDWPGLTYMRFRPRWIRYSDYGIPWKVEEFLVPA